MRREFLPGILPPSQLCGFFVRVDPHLAGSKKALKQGDTIIVSPAMYDLMRSSSDAELERLLGAIDLVEIPRFDLTDFPGEIWTTSPTGWTR